MTKYKRRQIANTARWKQAHTRSVNLTINKDKEKDLLDWLDKQPNKQAYIRGLIYKDMKKE